MSASAVPLIGLGIVLVFGAILFLGRKSKNTAKGKDLEKKASNVVNDITSLASKKEEKKTDKEQVVGYKKNTNANINKEDVFNFMEFDKIQDNMIISKKGEKFTAVIKCKGINYNLMSDVEQLAVEEGFINFLNTLKFPIQLYVQAQNIDLKENIRKFKANMENIEREYSDTNSEYNAVINSLDSTDDEIQEVEDKRESVLNVMEYGQDIVRYVEKLSINKSMLQRSFYVLVSYYRSEITNASNFKKEELLDICYSELFTRVQNILSGLSMSSVTGKSLGSNEIAELLYSAYNRDDKNYINIKQALDSGFHRLFSTSEDAIVKKNKKLLDNIREEAEFKAVAALEKALAEGNVVTVADIEDDYEERTSKMAIDMIKNERLDPKVKEAAKQEVISDYKEGKKERLQRREKEKQAMQKKVDQAKEKEKLDEELINGKSKEIKKDYEDVINSNDNSENAAQEYIGNIEKPEIQQGEDNVTGNEEKDTILGSKEGNIDETNDDSIV